VNECVRETVLGREVNEVREKHACDERKRLRGPIDPQMESTVIVRATEISNPSGST
jgi:hypothetical protein